jgi:hypothetical protein
MSDTAAIERDYRGASLVEIIMREVYKPLCVGSSPSAAYTKQKGTLTY